MRKRKSKIPKIDYIFQPEPKQGQLDIAFNLLFQEVLKDEKINAKLSTSVIGNYVQLGI
jgi:hypothetical protein